MFALARGSAWLCVITAIGSRFAAVLGGAGVTDIPPTDSPETEGQETESPETRSLASRRAAPHGERGWLRLIDALVGGGAALCLITAAHAALPRFEHHPAASRPRLAALPRRPAPPAPLIAFQAPEPGYAVVSPFGLRQLPWEASGRLHAGIDIAAPAGLPVVAAADGVVARMEVDGGYGRVVEVKHAAGLSTVYAHLARFQPQVAVGMAVKAGTPLGELGSSGSSTGAHLHFEVRDDQGRPLNPEMFIGHSFAVADDLPLRAAARIPRGVRVAYVSNIPKSKREEMEARLAAAAAANASADSDAAAPTQLAEASPSAADSGVDASAVVGRRRLPGERPHARLRLHE